MPILISSEYSPRGTCGGLLHNPEPAEYLCPEIECPADMAAIDRIYDLAYETLVAHLNAMTKARLDQKQIKPEYAGLEHLMIETAAIDIYDSILDRYEPIVAHHLDNIKSHMEGVAYRYRGSWDGQDQAEFVSDMHRERVALAHKAIEGFKNQPATEV